MIWLNIKGYEGDYQLSEKGDVRNISEHKSAHMVKCCRTSNGKLSVTLWKGGKRKLYMLHNLYSDIFEVPVKTAMQIIYEGYDGNAGAKDNVRKWLLEKIHECEQREAYGKSMNDEVLYLKSFLKQLSE